MPARWRLDRVFHAGEGVVRVDEKGHVVRLRVGVCVESALFIAEDLDPRMGVSAPHGDPEQASRQDVGGCRHAADVGRSGGGKRAVGALRASQAELED